MGIFDRTIPSDQIEKVGWKTLSTLVELDQVIQRSFEQPVAIFKHSTTCGISAMAKEQLFNGWDLPVEEVELYYLDLLAHRPVSNEVAARLGVVHQSPQIIVIKDGKAIYNISHHAISVDGVKKAIA